MLSPTLPSTLPAPALLETSALVSVPQDPAPPAEGGEGASTGSPLGSLLFPLLLVFAIFYFVMIGPERKQRRKREAMLKAIKKGDKVMTTGGMYASVAAVQEDVVTLLIADGVRVRYSMASIQAVLDEGAGEPKAKGAS